MKDTDRSFSDIHRIFLIGGTSLALSFIPYSAFADLTINNSERIIGEGEIFNAAGDTYVGRNTGYINPGVLTISGGASVTNRLGYVGYVNGSKGVVTVTGENSQWINTSELAIGFQGNGKLTIANGAMVTNTYGYIGHQLGDGSVIVTGANSV